MSDDSMEFGVEDVEEVKSEDEVKGPGHQWSDEAREARGAEAIPEVEELDDDGQPPKGPDPEEWGDDARVERGAVEDAPVDE